MTISYFHKVDFQNRLPQAARGSEQTAVPIAVKAFKTKSVEGGTNELACHEKSPKSRYVTHKNLWFYAVSQLIDATLTHLTTTGAITVEAQNRSQSKKETSRLFPIWRRACYPPKVVSIQL